MVSTGQRAEQQHRRRDDAAPGEPVRVQRTRPVQARAEAGGSPWLTAMLFVVGCALGGALIALFGLFEVAR